MRTLRGDPAPLAARAALAWNERALSVFFEVEADPPLVVDRSPAWANDCVEAFLATSETPWRYLELVVDAAGCIYAARVDNPDASRETWKLEPQSEPPAGVTFAVEGEGPLASQRKRWKARISIPWDAIEVDPAPRTKLRGNLFRIARGATTRHQALSPTFRDEPPEFHVPQRFAELVLLEPDTAQKAKLSSGQRSR